MAQVRLMTLDPGHFHAALVQKEMYPGVASRGATCTPRSGRTCSSTWRGSGLQPPRPRSRPRWEWRSTPAPDYFERMLRENPGNVVVLSGRNRGKIDRIAGLGRGRPERARPTSRGS